MPDDDSQQPQQDLEDLARRYVDLWQDQMTALAADPDFAESLQKVMAGLGVAASGLPALWSAWPAALASVMAAAGPAGAEEGQQSHGQPAGRGKAEPRPPSGSTAAAAAPDGGGPDLGGLAQRLAAVEQRIAALEGGSGRARRRPKAKPERD